MTADGCVGRRIKVGLAIPEGESQVDQRERGREEMRSLGHEEVDMGRWA